MQDLIAPPATTASQPVTISTEDRAYFHDLTTAAAVAVGTGVAVQNHGFIVTNDDLATLSRLADPTSTITQEDIFAVVVTLAAAAATNRTLADPDTLAEWMLADPNFVAPFLALGFDPADTAQLMAPMFARNTAPLERALDTSYRVYINSLTTPQN